MAERNATRVSVIYPLIKNRALSSRDSSARLEETIGLANAIDVDIVYKESVRVNKINPATYIGKGGVERLAEIFSEKEVELAIIDCQLSPVQQRNLETALKCKIIDRTALILEIFGERANTKEGVLQVELAHLIYQRSRLVRSWTHLERQRGGFGFTGGPGETQIELDRRLISERISKIKNELETVKRTRELHRKARKKVPYPTVALVGYTNAGKSTLFNRLTNADVYAKDQLFATLDPTMRQLDLPSGRSVILSDTVGFISDLPTELVAAFRATLEEVIEADIILHVRDISHPDTKAQKEDVEDVLKNLGLEEALEQGIMLEAMNKIDLLEDDERTNILKSTGSHKSRQAISAISGEGVEQLLKTIDDRISVSHKTIEVEIPYHDGASIAWIHQNGEVLETAENDTGMLFTIRIEDADMERLKNREGITIKC